VLGRFMLCQAPLELDMALGYSLWPMCAESMFPDDPFWLHPILEGKSSRHRHQLFPCICRAVHMLLIL